MERFMLIAGQVWAAGTIGIAAVGWLNIRAVIARPVDLFILLAWTGIAVLAAGLPRKRERGPRGP